MEQFPRAPGRTNQVASSAYLSYLHATIPLPATMFARIFQRNGATEVADQFAASLNSIVALEQLLDYVAAHLADISGARSVYILLAQPITDRHTCRKALGGEWDIVISPGSKLLGWLSVNQTSLDLGRNGEVADSLTAPEREAIRRADIGLIIPCFVIGRLSGLLLFGRREDGRLYRESDIALLSRLARQAALAFEHATMYQLQEDRLKKLFLADKLATIGELAARAAHELRNPLTTVRSTVQYLKKSVPLDKAALTEAAIEEIDRMDGIIRGMLSLSRVSDLQLCEVDLQDQIGQTLTILESELRLRNILPDFQSHTENVSLLADASGVRQLLLNILLNSIQAMPEGGPIAVLLEDDSGRPPGEGLRLIIRDTGTGIPARDLQKVFDPFFTTKENGTGLGLSICYGIVHRHGGEIDISSVSEGEERGTTVTIRLPRGFNNGGGSKVRL
jgi:signal transduction histidine kinase